MFTNAFVQDQIRISQWEAFLNRTGLGHVTFEVVMDHIHTFLYPIYESLLDEDEFFNTWGSKDKKWIKKRE